MPKSYGQIKRVMQECLRDVVPDMSLAKALSKYRVGFMNKNEDHSEFFGGNLTGVNVVRFTAKDRDMLFNDILGIDEYELEDKLHSIKYPKSNQLVVDPVRLVSSDAMSNVLVYLMHIFMTSKLPDKVKNTAVMDCTLVMNYRFLTSILFQNFKYPADKDYAQATYAQLSNKFALKKYGSWQKLLENRGQALYTRGSIHHKTIMEYEDDEKILYIITDTQGRIKGYMKNIYRLYLKVIASGQKVTTTSHLQEFDNDVILKDITKSLSVYTNYINSVISDKNGFVKQEILTLVCSFIHTANPRIVKETLEWFSNNYNYGASKEITELLSDIMIHSFNYLKDNRNTFRNTNDIGFLMNKLKGVYMSSKSKDPLLMSIKDRVNRYVKLSSKSKDNTVVASSRTAIMLYIVVRTFTMGHYSGA